MSIDWGLCPICKEPGKDGPCETPEGVEVCDGCYYEYWPGESVAEEIKEKILTQVVEKN